MGAVNLNSFLKWNHIVKVAITTALQVRPEGFAVIEPVNKAERETVEHDSVPVGTNIH